jgi:hypothetical protein
VLYARRFVAFVFYMAIQAASWYLIILLTTQSAELQLQIAAKAAMFAPYASSIVPAVVTVINALLPKLISLLTAIEKWDDVGFAIKAMVTRLYLAKILNVLIQMFSFALLLDPLLLTSRQTILDLVAFEGSAVRKNVMVEFKPASFSCRAEQASAGLLTLVVTDFSVSKVMAISSPLVKVVLKLLQRVWRRQREKRALAKKGREKSSSKVIPENTAVAAVGPDGAVGSDQPRISEVVVASSPESLVTKSEFLVPQKMVALLYSCTIALVAIPLAPTTALLALLLHVANFKFDKFILVVRTEHLGTSRPSVLRVIACISRCCLCCSIRRRSPRIRGVRRTLAASSSSFTFARCSFSSGSATSSSSTRASQSSASSRIPSGRPATTLCAQWAATTPLRDCVRSTQLAHLYVSNALPLAVPSSSELTALLPS